MEWIKLLLALVLPLLLGAVCMALLIPPSSRARTAIVTGNGMLLGLLAVPLLLRLLDSAGVTLTFYTAGALVAVSTALLGLACRIRRPHQAIRPRSDGAFAELSVAYRALVIFFALMIVLRISSVGLELLWRPLFPWDATMHWATKARVWFDTQSLAPFVENRQWLKMGGAGVFTDHHPGYPITTPLLQLWFALAIGHWDESLVNLPWLLCYMGLAAAFYGQARAAGSSIVTASAFTYMLLSMPLAGTHVALAGYADLFLGACYCAAIMAFHNWTRTRDRGQALMAVAFALCCPLIKNEGFFWLLTFFPALIVVLLPLRRAILLLASGLALLVAVLVLLPPDLAVAGHSLKELKLHYRPEALAGIARSLWVQDNWHLLGYLVVALLPLALLASKSAARELAGALTALLCALVLLLLLFLLTRYSGGAVRFTGVGRISLHLVPSLMFLCLLLWNQLSGRSPVRVAAGTAITQAGQ